MRRDRTDAPPRCLPMTIIHFIPPFRREASTFDFRRDPVLSTLFAYWQRKRQARSMPTRCALDPAGLPSSLPQLELVDIVSDRFRYQLAGTALASAFGRDYTGLYVDEILTGARLECVGGLLSVVRDAHWPMFMRARYYTDDDRQMWSNRLCVPLSHDDHRVSTILSALSFDFLGHEPISGLWGTAQIDPAASDVEVVNPNAQLGPNSNHK